MKRITVSIPGEQNEWLKQNPSISPSGLIQESIQMRMSQKNSKLKEQFAENICKRLRNAKLKRRPRIIIDDLKFPVTRYPIKEEDVIVHTVKSHDKEAHGKGSLPKSYFPHYEKQGVEHFTVECFEAPEGVIEPIVEFLSEIG